MSKLAVIIQDEKLGRARYKTPWGSREPNPEPGDQVCLLVVLGNQLAQHLMA